MSSIILENQGLLYEKAKAWANGIDKDAKEVNTERRDYMRKQDLWMFAMLINPELENVITDSTFESIMPYEAHTSFQKEDKIGEYFLQIEYFSWLIYEAVSYRKSHSAAPLSIHINYRGVNFLKRVNEKQLGEDTKLFMKLMMRQSEGSVKLFIYDEYILQEEITNEDELEFT